MGSFPEMYYDSFFVVALPSALPYFTHYPCFSVKYKINK